MRILGISALGHDSAAALVEDGRILAAAQEERFSRTKHDGGFPALAMGYCLEVAGCGLAGIDGVALYGKPASIEPLRRRFADLDREGRLLVVGHHLSHAASAFFPSPFARAAVLTVDGLLDRTTTALAVGEGNRLEILRELHVPHSPGLLYSAVTRYLGFKANSGEYKVMGLAPYGEPTYAGLILDRVMDLQADGSFRLDPSWTDLATTGDRLTALLGHPARRPDGDPLERFHMDLAASVQAVTEQVMLRLARTLRDETGARALCLGGGGALNCVANGLIVREGLFDEVWIQPASGDAGGALGAALAGCHLVKGGARDPGPGDAMQGSCLGPDFAQGDIEARLAAAGARFAVHSDDALLGATAEALAAGRAVGWVQGRMEFGPRALGNRSILADPRSPTMQRLLNLKVKYRESFRPFAPSVLQEDAAEWFELDGDSPYMLLVAPVRQRHRRAMTAEENALAGVDRLTVARSTIPAVTHVDYSARIQTVAADTNPRFHALLGRFKALTACGVLVNTSFNVRGEPIVCTPEDAFRCFMGSGIEALAVGNCLLAKEEQDPALGLDYRTAFAPD